MQYYEGSCIDEDPESQVDLESAAHCASTVPPPPPLPTQKIYPAHCVYGPKLQELAKIQNVRMGDKFPDAKDKGQRVDCNCTDSRDIGEYYTEDDPCIALALMTSQVPISASTVMHARRKNGRKLECKKCLTSLGGPLAARMGLKVMMQKTASRAKCIVGCCDLLPGLRLLVYNRISLELTNN